MLFALSSSFSRWSQTGLVAALLFCGVPLIAAEEEKTPQQADGQSAIENVLLVEAAAVPQEGTAGGGYWIGLICHAVDDRTRGELKLDQGQGLVIDLVVPDGPAAKAGLKKDDVIVSTGDRPLGTVEQLAKVIAGTGESALKLEIVRGGKRQTIEVKPAKRAAEGQVIVFGERNEGKANDVKSNEAREAAETRLRQMVESLQAQQRAGAGAWGVVPQPGAPRPGMPGMAMPGAPMNGTLPDDMQVTVQKRGNKPARIMVEQGEKAWKTTEDQLDMLPPEARGYVARLLGRPMAAGGFGGGFGGAAVPGAPWAPMAQYQIKLDEKSKVQLENNARQPNPVITQSGAVVKSVPGGGISIEIREGNDEASETKTQVRKLVPSRPEPAKDQQLDHQLRELREHFTQLQRKLDELAKAIQDRR